VKILLAWMGDGKRNYQIDTSPKHRSETEIFLPDQDNVKALYIRPLNFASKSNQQTLNAIHNNGFPASRGVLKIANRSQTTFRGWSILNKLSFFKPFENSLMLF